MLDTHSPFPYYSDTAYEDRHEPNTANAPSLAQGAGAQPSRSQSSLWRESGRLVEIRTPQGIPGPQASAEDCHGHRIAAGHHCWGSVMSDLNITRAGDQERRAVGAGFRTESDNECTVSIHHQTNWVVTLASLSAWQRTPIIHPFWSHVQPSSSSLANVGPVFNECLRVGARINSEQRMTFVSGSGEVLTQRNIVWGT